MNRLSYRKLFITGAAAIDHELIYKKQQEEYAAKWEDIFEKYSDLIDVISSDYIVVDGKEKYLGYERRLDIAVYCPKCKTFPLAKRHVSTLMCTSSLYSKIECGFSIKLMQDDIRLLEKYFNDKKRLRLKFKKKHTPPCGYHFPVYNTLKGRENFGVNFKPKKDTIRLLSPKVRKTIRQLTEELGIYEQY